MFFFNDRRRPEIYTNCHTRSLHCALPTWAGQRALQERTEAREMADRLKSEFLANVSYELRTPLNAIIGFSEILEQEYAGPMNDRQKEYARAIMQSSNRLVRLVNDILDQIGRAHV